jgi:hypothetical protein
LRSYTDFTREYTDSNLKIAGIVVNWPNDKIKDNRSGQADIQQFAADNNVHVFQDVDSLLDTLPRWRAQGIAHFSDTACETRHQD